VKILYVSQYYPPEMGAPAARAAELARHWIATGHEVSILTGFPNHPTGFVPPEWKPRLRRLIYRENDGGARVFRTWLWPLPNRKSHERIRNYSSFCLSAAIRGMSLSRPDVIIGTSPQLLVGLSAWWLAKVHRVPFLFEVRDLWPESLAAVGVGSENSPLHRTLGAIARFLYARSDHIVVVTPAFKEHLIRQWQIPEEKISVVENGVETELFSPAANEITGSVRAQLGVSEKFLVCYIGTMGMAHGLETLIQAARRLRSEQPSVHFLLIGEGAEKERIRDSVRKEQLANITILDQQPREKIPGFISACDAALVLLKKTDVFKTVIPTKLLEFLACARPVILGVEGQARQLMEAAQAGIAIEPENSEALCDALLRLYADPPVGKELGRNGREYVVRCCSRRSTAEHYIQVLRRVLNGARDRQAIPA